MSYYMPIMFVHSIRSKSVLSKVTDLQVGRKSFLQFCFLLSVAFLYFFWDLWSRGHLIHRGVRQSLCPSYKKKENSDTHKSHTNINWQFRGKSIIIQMCVESKGVQTLIFSKGILWHRASGILSADGSFGFAWTLTWTTPLADHEPTNALKGEVIHLLAINQSRYTHKKQFSLQSWRWFEIYWLWLYGWFY